MTALTGRPFLGTLPWIRGLGLDGEDSLALDAPRPVKPPRGSDVLRVAVARLGRISNFTDFDALAHEPGVSVRFTESAEEILNADLAVLPGTKTTIEDLNLLRLHRLDRAFAQRTGRGLPTLGICGGYQMLGGCIADGVESGESEARGLGLLPVETVFEREKVLGRPRAWRRASGTRGSRLRTRSTTEGSADSVVSPSSRLAETPRAAGWGRP
jgi:adenosylcobyric acid synthase